MKVYTTKIPPAVWVLIGALSCWLLLTLMGKFLMAGYNAGQTDAKDL